MAFVPAETAPRAPIAFASEPQPVERLRESAPPEPPPALDPRDRRGPFRPERLAPARGRLSGATLKQLFTLGDRAAVLLITIAAAVSAAGSRGVLAQPLAELTPFLGAAAITLWALSALDVNRFGNREDLGLHLVKVSLSVLLGGACALLLARVASPDTRTPALIWTAGVLAAELGGHAMGWAQVRRWRRDGRLTPNVVVVGATDNAARLIESALATREVAVLGIFDDRAGRVPPSLKGVPVLGDTRSLLTHKVLPYVDLIVITVSPTAQARVRELIGRLSVLPNAVTLFVDDERPTAREAALSRIADAPLRLVSGTRHDERRALVKRISDIVLAGAGLIAAAPLLALVALAVRLDSPGPVMFRQRRHGFNNEVITVWKFRSMRQESSDQDARRQVAPDDERVTRVGRFIRRTSLDELPQLWNVLRGEMSLVGPRPHAVGMLTEGEESNRLVAEYAWRHRMKPGITGWAQINGSRGPVANAADIRRRVALDVEYIERQSFWFDYIVLMTVPRLLGDGETVR